MKIIKTDNKKFIHVNQPGNPKNPMDRRTTQLLAAFTLSAYFGLALLPAPAQTFTNLHSFDALVSLTNNDGALPYSALVLSGNTLYSTANKGGAFSNGTVFAVNTDGTSFTNLHSFTPLTGPLRTNADGAQPIAGLILSGNMLYGTTPEGGPGRGGTIYAINTDGTGFTNLHNFAVNDGDAVTAGLVVSGNTLYGAAQGGGSNAVGLIFALNTDGSGFTNLHTFPAEGINSTNSGGGQPVAGLVVSGTNLFGTTWTGGTGGKGTIFRMNTNGTGFTNLHSFSVLVTNNNGAMTNRDGAMPEGALTWSGNTLYGVTPSGGPTGNGTLFAINTDGSGFTNFHTFTVLNNMSNVDGAEPFGGLYSSGNALYGTTPAGGSGTNGTLFVVNTDGTSFTVLYNFSRLAATTNSDGAAPVSGILSSNTLYGLAHTGGSGGSGTVFSLFLAPVLTLDVSGANAILIWPTNADGFALQSATNLTPPSVWSDVLPAPVVINGQYAVTNSMSTDQMFYRLAR